MGASVTSGQGTETIWQAVSRAIEMPKNQVAAIRLDADRQTTGIVVTDNLLRGENRAVRVDGEGRTNVTLRRNE
jgi:hypothetical protein